MNFPDDVMLSEPGELDDLMEAESYEAAVS